MAGEASSSTAITVAFQRKCNAEWCKLRKHLHLQLQQDIARIYANSSYCDLELVIGSSRIKTHRSILQVRAANFFRHVCNKTVLSSDPKNVTTVIFERACSDNIKQFVRNAYYKCSIAEEENNLLHYLQEINEPYNTGKGRLDFCKLERETSQDSGLSPESDIYLTPNCSPSDFSNSFCEVLPQKIKTEKVSTSSDDGQGITDLHKTNRSYYTIVAVDDTAEEREDTAEELIKQEIKLDVLERELAEQDELSKSFESIKSKEERKAFKTTCKIKKPTSLPVSSSLCTKKQKRVCDGLFVNNRFNKQNPCSSEVKSSSCPRGSKPSVIFSINEVGEKHLGNISGSQKVFSEKLDEKITLKRVDDHVNCSELCWSANDFNFYLGKKITDSQENVEEEFISSPRGETDCDLKYCQGKNSKDLLVLTPCSPEMDTSGGGPDSGLDTCSTGCVPGGGFNSPREHTASETSGVDLTEAALGEDMPHDGEAELHLLKPTKSSDSSSVSSEAGTWDTTFPPSNTIQDLQDPQAKIECNVVSKDMKITISDECNVENSEDPPLSVLDKACCPPCQSVLVDPQKEVSEQETNVEFMTTSKGNQNSSTHVEKCIGEMSHLKYENTTDTFEVTASEINESNGSEVLTESCDTDMLKHRRKVSSLGDLHSEYLVDSHQPTSGEKCKDWKIDTSLGASSNYFINAATLVDDSELPTSLPPLYIHETTYTVKENLNRFGEKDDLSLCDFSTKTPTSSPTEIQEDIKHIALSPENVPEEESKSASETIQVNTAENGEVFPVKEHTKEDTQISCDRIDSNNEPCTMRVTFLKMGGTRHEVKLLNGQDLFAEFQKEIRMTEHLEPHVIRNHVTPGGKYKLDLEHTESESVCPENDIVIDNSTCYEIQEKHETETVTEDEISRSKAQEHELLLNQGELQNFSLNKEESDNIEKNENAPNEEETEEMEVPRRSSLIRRNTFELDPDEEHIALLRQEYERRQGNLLFQNCIPQFSGHITGSEGFRDSHSLIVVSTENRKDIPLADEQQMSLPELSISDSLTRTSMAYVEDSLPDQIPHNTSVGADQQFESFQDESAFANTSKALNHVMECSLSGENEDFNVTANDNALQENVEIIKNHEGYECDQSEHISEDYMVKCENPGFSRQSSYDIACKPVISGALTCSDLGLEEKHMWDSPKKHQKRTESTPIVSGGVSTIDFSIPLRKVSESPIMRRKNEAAPILSGAAPVCSVSKDISESKPSSNSSSIAAAWVVDMSDCTGNASKPPLDTRRHRKSDSISGLHQLQNTHQSNFMKEEPSTGTLPRRSESKVSSGLGFFVDLKPSPGREQTDTKHMDKRENIRDTRLQKSLESTPVNVGYFVEFEGSKSQTHELWERKSSSFEEKRELRRQSSRTDENNSSGVNSPCFFVDLGNKRQVPVTKESDGKRLSSEDEREISTPERKNTIFSMFIDIGNSKQESTGRHGSTESVKNKVAASPLLSSNKKLGMRRASRDSSERSSRPNSATFDLDDQVPPCETPKAAIMYVDASTPVTKRELGSSQSQPSSLEETGDKIGNKKQSFFMFIENESPVIRRKTLPSGLKPSFNRHSWNPETRSTPQSEDSRLIARRQHKRAHSVSVDRSSICSPGDENKSSSSNSLLKAQQQGSSHSLCESALVSDVGMPQMSASCHARLSSKSQDKFLQQTFSVEEQTEDDVQGHSNSNRESVESKGEEKENTKVSKVIQKANINIIESELENTEELSEITEVCVMDKSLSSENTSSPDTKLVDTVKSEMNIDTIKTERANEIQTSNSNEIFPFPESTDVKNKTHLSAERKGQSSEIEKQEENTGGNFVRLSDLDKGPIKTHEISDTSDLMPSFSATNRMTRSIPETSWIENKLLMSRSIGGRSTSKSLSRLFPHLHTGGSSSSTPSSVPHSKSPGGQMEVDDNDMQVSETSDLSSMQSSMGPSGLGSTEETDASSSYAGRNGPVSRLGEDLLRMFLEEVNPDVTVEVGGRRLKAHKCILSSRCQFFAAMLSGGWVESAGNVISLQGFSYNAVHFALCHIYSGTSNIPDTISIVELATLADMWGLEGLKEVIMYTLKVKYCHFFHKPCTMCTIGVLECLPLAAAYGLDEIYRKSLRWITKYFVRIWPTKGFATLPRELIEKCYQQHVVHMTVDNVLETLLGCDKLLATLPSDRWAGSLFGITSQLFEASVKFLAHNFCGVLCSETFLALGKEHCWTISRLEDNILAATHRLPPDQCCQSYSRLNEMLIIARNPERPPEVQWSQNFVELLDRIQKHVEATLVRQARWAARCQSWVQMDAELRKKIQDKACLVLLPGEEHRSRSSNMAKRGSSGGSSAYSTGPRSVSTSGLRSLDLRQVRLAMTQQARRAASGGRVSTLKTDTKVKTQVKQQHVQPAKTDIVTTEESCKASNGETSTRPKTWPMRVLENKSRPIKCRVNSSTSNTATPDKSNGTAPRRTGKIMISSSDSSRTSSPAMRRSAPGTDGSGRSRVTALSSSAGRNINRSDTPPGRDMKIQKKRDLETTGISTDSLTESPSSGTKRSVKELSENSTSRSSISTRPDTPSVRRKIREGAVVSSDSLSSGANGEKVAGKEATSLSAPSHSSINTRPETPKERKKHALGRLSVEVTISSDSLATDSSYAGEISIGSREARSSTGSAKTENRAGKLVKVSNVKNENQRSPVTPVRKVTRQSVSTPRESPTARVRSAVTSSPYTGSPSLRRSLLLASKSEVSASPVSGRQSNPATSSILVKSEKLNSKLPGSPSVSTSSSKRTPLRNPTRSQVVASPAKPIIEGTKASSVKCSTKETVSTPTPIRAASSKASNVAKKPINGCTADGKNKRFPDNSTKLPPVSKREDSVEKPPSVGSRSGTFLKDEPTILKKPDIDDVEE